MRLLDAFFAARPLVLVPAWSFLLLGHAAAEPGAGFPLLRFVLLTLVQVGTHLVNQVADFETDRINGKGLFLQQGIFSRQEYRVAAGIAFAGAAALALWRGEPLVVLGAAGALGLAYSLPPLRLAARPGADVAANAVGYGVLSPLVGCGWDARAPLPLAAAFLAAAALAVACVFLHTTLLDLEGDRRTGKRTTGTCLGPRGTRIAAALLGSAAAAVAWAGGSAALGLATGGVALLALAAAAGAPWPRSRALGVSATGLFALATVPGAPAFAPAILLLAVATRRYYGSRFGLRYPAA